MTISNGNDDIGMDGLKIVFCDVNFWKSQKAKEIANRHMPFI